jgi:hypothetical protein
MDIKQTQKRIIESLASTQRDGIGKLIDWLCLSDFFTAPASTRFHGCYEGGLASHSLSVYSLLNVWGKELELNTDTSAGKKPLPVTDDTIIVAGLLHDVCKVGAYIPTPDGKNPYKWNRQQPKGHATLSIARIQEHIELDDLETMVIRYHMGVYGLNEFYEEGDWQSGEYPLRGDHSDDDNMTKEESKAKRYGASLANAWYHNPIVKFMYFADELATAQEKA